MFVKVPKVTGPFNIKITLNLISKEILLHFDSSAGTTQEVFENKHTIRTINSFQQITEMKEF